MKKFLDHVWFNFIRLFQWHRIIGITALSIAAYFLVFVAMKKTNVSWLLPPSYTPRFHWPDLPPFFTWKEDHGKAQETIYTVPTQKITAQELAQIKAEQKPTNPR